MIEAMIAGALAGYAVAVPVGAIAALIVTLTARSGLRIGAAAALGVATADGIYALVAVLGGTAVARLVEPAAEGLRWVAGAVLIALAARTAVTAVREARVQSHAESRSGEPAADAASKAAPRVARTYLTLLGLTLLNPATVIYFVALVIGYGQDRRWIGAGAAVFVLAAFVASATWQLTLAGGGSVVGRVVTGRRGRLATALISSAVITAFAVGLVASG